MVDPSAEGGEAVASLSGPRGDARTLETSVPGARARCRRDHDSSRADCVVRRHPQRAVRPLTAKTGVRVP